MEEGLINANGQEAIRLKGQKFNELIEEMQGGYTGEPIIGGTHFSLTMGMDVTMKGRDREKMDEICVYEVKEGKIVKEQFFYWTKIVYDKIPAWQRYAGIILFL